MTRFLISFLGIIMLINLTGCGGEDMDYKKACSEKDWPKAYSIVDKLKQEALPHYEKWQSANGTRYGWAIEAEVNYNAAMSKYEEAYRYVVLQETMSELEQGNLMRIAAIVKEQNADWVYEELIQIAESIGEKDLSQKLTEMAGANKTNSRQSLNEGNLSSEDNQVSDDDDINNSIERAQKEAEDAVNAAQKEAEEAVNAAMKDAQDAVNSAMRNVR